MMKLVENLFEKAFHERNLNQKIAIFFVFMFVVILIGCFLIVSPLKNYESNLKNQLINFSNQLNLLITEVNRYQKLQKLPPNNQLNEKIKVLENEYNGIVRADIKKTLVYSPDKMREVENALTKTNSEVQLMNIDHKDNSIILSLRGDYLGIFHYLQYLDELPWAFTYDAFQYQVTQYPNADVNLTIRFAQAPVNFYKTPLVSANPTKPIDWAPNKLEKIPDNLKVTGVFRHGSEWSAVIDGKYYVVGDRVGTYKISKITETKVYFVTDKGIVEIEFIPQIKTKPVDYSGK